MSIIWSKKGFHQAQSMRICRLLFYITEWRSAILKFRKGALQRTHAPEKGERNTDRMPIRMQKNIFFLLNFKNGSESEEPSFVSFAETISL